MIVGCHSLVFGALPAADALEEIARVGFECAVIAEIEGQVMHASQLSSVALMDLVGLDVATDDPQRIQSAFGHARRLEVSAVMATAGRGTLRSPVPPSQIPEGLARKLARPPGPLTVTPRAGTSVWNVETALRLAVDHGAPLWPDTSHLARAGDDIVAAASALAPHSVGWFIRDHDGLSAGPGAFEIQVPGRGALPLGECTNVLRVSGFTGPIVFHAVGHIPRGVPHPEYPIARLRELAREARAYLERYVTSSSARPT